MGFSGESMQENKKAIKSMLKEPVKLFRELISVYQIFIIFCHFIHLKLFHLKNYRKKVCLYWKDGVFQNVVDAIRFILIKKILMKEKE